MPKGIHTSPRNPIGRGAQPTRPGRSIKAVLMAQVPLAYGPENNLVTEATIVDICNAYKQLITQENHLRPEARRLKGTTYPSFYALFRLAKSLGLVELVRDEPMESPPPRGSLYSLRKEDDEVVAKVSTRRVYRLTDKGKADESSWDNLMGAYLASR